MAESYITVLWSFGLAAVLCFGLEFCLLPAGGQLWRRKGAIWAGHLAVLLLIYLLELLVFRRPWFAASQVVFWQALMLVVNRVKLAQLYEPFVYQDLHYFVDIFRHPRLYLPFFGFDRLALAIFVPVVLVGLALQLEAPLGLTQLLWPLLGLFLAMLLLTLGCWHYVSPLVGIDPALDQAEMGMLGGFIAYAKAERQLAQLAEPLDCIPSGGTQPHLVVVQSESFFDARRLWPAIHPQCYRWFDQLNHAALLHGELTVPAVGANTLRTEFAFLTGLTNSEQGIHRFNPYRRLARQQLTTLASRLKAEGYRTVCVHPYPVSFYQRDRVFPHLGFDEFIARKGFSHHSDNHYVGDIEVAERVQQILQQATEPTFVFVITMENHGPLQLEKVGIEEPAEYLTALPPKSVQELTAYLRHVVNAGKMAQILCDTLQQTTRPGLLCWYGDHLPILPELYQAEQFDSHRTDYVVWASAQQHSGLASQPVAERQVHELANLLLTLLAQHK